MKRLKLDPDLFDGESKTVHDHPDGVLLGLIRTWMDESEPGATIVIELIEMTDKEAEALPEV